MDQQKLLELLQGSLVPDTNKVIKATAELQKNYYPNPQVVPALIEICTSHPDASVRQQAAVFATRQVPKHWSNLEGSADKDAIRKHLLQSTLKEPTRLVRHSESRLIAAIASVDIPDNKWPDLLPGIISECQNGATPQREVCSFILFALLEDDPTHFHNELSGLIGLFQTIIRDPESSDVRINAMQAASCVLDMINPDEDSASLTAIQNLIPSMVDVLKEVIVANDDEKIKIAFEVIQSLLFYESAIVNNHLPDLMQFMAELSANAEAESEVRIMALTFLNQAVRYRRMKVQGMKIQGVEMGSLLTVKAMAIVAEIEDDEDDDEITPGRTALGLIDQLAADLPPKQVIVPLLNELPKFSKSENPAFRKAGILSLGTCVEGAPDFVSTQLSSILPILMSLLHDSEVSVRSAALVGLTRLAEEMSEALAPYHKDLMHAVLQNLEFAKTNSTIPSPETAAKKNVAIIRIVCAALDSVVDGLEEDDMVTYAPELIKQIAPLLSHDDHKIKAAASGALGAIAQSIGKQFTPYFDQTVAALAPYIVLKGSEEDMDLRSSVCDSMGRLATAVGPDAFRPYLNDLMLASEEGLNLGNSRLKETSFILWSSLSKVYEGQFSHYLPGVMQGLFSSLELEEEEISIAVDDAANIASVEEAIVSQGKKIKVKAVKDDEMDEDEEAEDFVTISAQALEKEIAIEVLGDVIAHACDAGHIAAYLEKSVEMVAPLVEHTYEGIRKASIGCLYRCYARLVQLTEETTGQKWDSNPPLQPTEAIMKLGNVVFQATASIWEEETDRNVVAEINRNIAAVLKTCGPMLLDLEPKFHPLIINTVNDILKRKHTSQQDFGDFDDDEIDPAQGTSEYDWVTIDTALDVLIGLSVVMKGEAASIWEKFQKPLLKLAVSDEDQERSVAVGVIAEMTAHIGATITPYTEKILNNILRRLSDTDLETRSNAAYAAGQLIFHSTASELYLPHFNSILQKLESMLNITESRLRDNAAGCLCRMVMKHPDQVPLPEVLPALVSLLPLKQDYEENTPVYKCIFFLYEKSDATIQSLTPQLIPVFGQVLSPPQDQLNDETRQIVCSLVAELYEAQPALFASHPTVVQAAGLS